MGFRLKLGIYRHCPDCSWGRDSSRFMEVTKRFTGRLGNREEIRRNTQAKPHWAGAAKIWVGNRRTEEVIVK